LIGLYSINICIFYLLFLIISYQNSNLLKELIKHIKYCELCSTDTVTDTDTTRTWTQRYVKSLKCRTRGHRSIYYELYKLTINIYVYRYVPDYFLSGSQEFISYFYNHNDNLYNKIWFFKKLMYFFFLKLC